MLKFAFIVNNPGYNPETYSGVYENDASYNVVAGIDNMDMAVEYVAKLVSEGFTLFNLCGDFDDEITAKMQQAAGENVKIRHADYLPPEAAKVEALEVFTKYGVIVVMKGVETPQEVYLKCDGLETKTIFVKDQAQANAAAKDLLSWGAHDIELCSWFTEEKTQSVIDAIGGAIPVGSCGLQEIKRTKESLLNDSALERTAIKR